MLNKYRILPFAFFGTSREQLFYFLAVSILFFLCLFLFGQTLDLRGQLVSLSTENSRLLEVCVENTRLLQEQSMRISQLEASVELGKGLLTPLLTPEAIIPSVPVETYTFYDRLFIFSYFCVVIAGLTWFSLVFLQPYIPYLAVGSFSFLKNLEFPATYYGVPAEILWTDEVSGVMCKACWCANDKAYDFFIKAVGSGEYISLGSYILSQKIVSGTAPLAKPIMTLTVDQVETLTNMLNAAAGGTGF